MICGGPDSNRRTPTGTDLESVAFDLARQPPLSREIKFHVYKFFVFSSWRVFIKIKNDKTRFVIRKLILRYFTSSDFVNT